MAPPKIQSAPRFFGPPSNLRVEVKDLPAPVLDRPPGDTFVANETEAIYDLRPLNVAIPKYFVDTRFEVHTPATLVDLALRFAAASYENRAGTDEEAVFYILHEVVARGPEAKQEFQEILTAMAKANKDGKGISYYEKVREQVQSKLEGRELSSVGFVEMVLRDEMEGILIAAEYKEAMHLWEGTALAGDIENVFEGVLNSIANLGEMALEHPVLAGALIGIGAGLVIVGGAPVVAKTALGWRFLSLLPALSQGLEKLGLVSMILFGAKSVYHSFKASIASNGLQRGREVRECGEAFANLMLVSYSYFRGSEKAAEVQLSRTSKLASEMLKEWSVDGALSRLRAADEITWVDEVFSRVREFRGIEFVMPFLSELRDAELLQYSSQVAKLLQSHPQLLASPEGVRIYSVIESSLPLEQQFSIISGIMSQPKSQWVLLAQASSRHPLVASFHDLLRVNVHSDASEVFAERLVRLLEIAKEDVSLHSGLSSDSDQARLVHLISHLIFKDFSGNPLPLSEAQGARLIGVLTSPEFLRPTALLPSGMSEVLQSLFPVLNREINEAILIGLDLQILLDPANASFIQWRNNLAVLEAVQRIESGQVGRLTVAQSDFEFSKRGFCLLQPGEKKVLVIQMGDSNKIQIVAQAKRHNGNDWYWHLSPSRGDFLKLPTYDLRIKGEFNRELLLVHADAQEAEAAFMKLWSDASLGRPGPAFPQHRSLLERIFVEP